jgi:hypothetical protein
MKSSMMGSVSYAGVIAIACACSHATVTVLELDGRDLRAQRWDAR